MDLIPERRIFIQLKKIFEWLGLHDDTDTSKVANF